MKKISILLSVLISTLVSCAQEKTVNKIKSEEVIFYKIDDNGKEVRQNPAMNELVAYDVDGKLTKVYVTYY